MQVLALDEGLHCALSPNRSLYAIVRKGLTVVFMDYIRRTDERINNIKSGGEPIGSSCRNTATLQPQLCHRDAVISTHTALDEIHELQWAPDSTLVALLLARRQIIEIVSVYGHCCVARVEAGVAGLRAMRWHPSSRAVYWIGMLQAHVVSLLDGQVMSLAGNVKYSAQLAARRSSSMPALRMESSHFASVSLAAPSCVSATSSVRVSPPVSDAALIRFSPCNRFLIYVTPKALHSPLLTRREKQTAPPRALGKEAAACCSLTQDGDVEVNHPEKNTAADENKTDNFQRRTEWLVVSSATTHEGLHVFSTGHLVPNVSDCIPLHGGIALVDYIHSSLTLVTYQGNSLLHQERSGVQNVVSSPCKDVLFILFADSCRAVLVSKKRVVALREIMFNFDVALPLQLRELKVREEPVYNGDFTATASRHDDLFLRRSDALAEFHDCDDWARKENTDEPLKFCTAMMNASGHTAAVTLTRWPSCVLLVDVLQQRVKAVLRHSARVVGLCWGPSSASEFWGFCQRHYLRPGKEEDGDAADDAQEAVGVGSEEPLLVMTDNEDARVVLWLGDRALSLSASREARCEKKANVCDTGKHSNGVRRDDESTLPALRFNRCMFGEGASDAVLVDDVRGIALTVAFCANALGLKEGD